MLILPHEAAMRLGLALLYGAIIGVEREWRHKHAGMKTNTLVAIGSCAFALMSDTFGPNNHNPAQLAAAVVSGIGFIGAGVILRRGGSVQGVTTAATLWANASMGVAVGLGDYAVGSLIFFGIVVVQFGMRRAVALILRRGPRSRELELRVECTESSIAQVNRAWTAFAATGTFTAVRRSTVRTASGIVWRAIFVAVPERELDLTTIEEQLFSVPGVTRVDARPTVLDDEPS